MDSPRLDGARMKKVRKIRGVGELVQLSHIALGEESNLSV